MAQSRALITETEREYIAEKGSNSRKYEAVSRVRARIFDELPKDVAVLAEHHPKLLEELRKVTCNE